MKAVIHNVHVTQTPGNRTWRVSQGGNTLSTHRLKSKAVDAGRGAARRARVKLVTHTSTGVIAARS